MKKRQILALTGVFLIVGAVITVGPLAAKSTKTPVDFWEVSCEVDPGTSWISDDGILHGRGRVSAAVFYAQNPLSGLAEIVGFDTVVSNANLDLATFSGRVSGTFTLTYFPASDTGTFDGSFNGSLTAGLFTGRAVSHGTGPLRGSKMKLKFETIGIPQWLQDELDSSPPSCGLVPPTGAGIYHDTGFIHNPR